MSSISGITTVLTLTTLQMDSRQNLPKVAYATALDWFVVMCFVFIIASMFEFAGVHYFTKVSNVLIQLKDSYNIHAIGSIFT
jgi:gamma-aminobutyric acid receptor subunit alpha